NDQHQLQHLDIKPQNLFMLHNHVKVADFGQVKDLQGVMASVTGGITPVYAAPETFDGLVSRYCDQYSLACVYQELLTGIRPFDGLELETPFPRGLSETDNHVPLPAAAPPEQTGPGPLRPALVIGLGQAGLRVLQRLRHDLAVRFGPPAFTPLVRTLYVDTDT